MKSSNNLFALEGAQRVQFEGLLATRVTQVLPNIIEKDAGLALTDLEQQISAEVNALQFSGPVFIVHNAYEIYLTLFGDLASKNGNARYHLLACKTLMEKHIERLGGGYRGIVDLDNIYQYAAGVIHTPGIDNAYERARHIRKEAIRVLYSRHS